MIRPLSVTGVGRVCLTKVGPLSTRKVLNVWRNFGSDERHRARGCFFKSGVTLQCRHYNEIYIVFRIVKFTNLLHRSDDETMS